MRCVSCACVYLCLPLANLTYQHLFFNSLSHGHPTNPRRSTLLPDRSLSSLSIFFPLLLLLSSLSSSVSALRLIASPTTTTNAPTTVYWIREPSDPQPLFDLRFVVQEDGKDIDDVGLAAANIPVNTGEGDGESRMGKQEVRFPNSG